MSTTYREGQVIENDGRAPAEPVPMSPEPVAEPVASDAEPEPPAPLPKAPRARPSKPVGKHKR